MDKQLLISEKELNLMSPQQIDDYSAEKAKYILTKINESTEAINKAKEKAMWAQNPTKDHWWQNVNKIKADITADAVVLTNEAVSQLNELVQQSIQFTCVSTAFARSMAQNIHTFIDEGFKDRDGRIVSLNDASREQAEFIIKQAENFADNQSKNEEKQVFLDARIKEQAEAAEDNRQNIENLSKKMSEKERIDAEQTQRLKELAALLDNKDLVDQNQEEAIASNKSEIVNIKNTLNEKNVLDDNQSKKIEKNENAIKILYDYMKTKDELDKQQSKEIEMLKKQKSFVLSVISIILSGAAIVICTLDLILNFVKF